MSCQIVFTIDKGTLTTKAQWDNKSAKDIKLFRTFLLLLQRGEYASDIVESIGKFGNKSNDKSTAKNIIKHIIDKSDFEGRPVVTPQDIGNEINFEE